VEEEEETAAAEEQEGDHAAEPEQEEAEVARVEAAGAAEGQAGAGGSSTATQAVPGKSLLKRGGVADGGYVAPDASSSSSPDHDYGDGSSGHSPVALLNATTLDRTSKRDKRKSSKHKSSKHKSGKHEKSSDRSEKDGSKKHRFKHHRAPPPPPPPPSSPPTAVPPAAAVAASEDELYEEFKVKFEERLVGEYKDALVKARDEVDACRQREERGEALLHKVWPAQAPCISLVPAVSECLSCRACP
jgi:hypothetical protein